MFKRLASQPFGVSGWMGLIGLLVAYDKFFMKDEWFLSVAFPRASFPMDADLPPGHPGLTSPPLPWSNTWQVL